MNDIDNLFSAAEGVHVELTPRVHTCIYIYVYEPGSMQYDFRVSFTAMTWPSEIIKLLNNLLSTLDVIHVIKSPLRFSMVIRSITHVRGESLGTRLYAVFVDSSFYAVCVCVCACVCVCVCVVDIGLQIYVYL